MKITKKIIDESVLKSLFFAVQYRWNVTAFTRVGKDPNGTISIKLSKLSEVSRISDNKILKCHCLSYIKNLTFYFETPKVEVFSIYQFSQTGKHDKKIDSIFVIIQTNKINLKRRTILLTIVNIYESDTLEFTDYETNSGYLILGTYLNLQHIHSSFIKTAVDKYELLPILLSIVIWTILLTIVKIFESDTFELNSICKSFSILFGQGLTIGTNIIVIGGLCQVENCSSDIIAIIAKDPVTTLRSIIVFDSNANIISDTNGIIVYDGSIITDTNGIIVFDSNGIIELHSNGIIEHYSYGIKMWYKKWCTI